MKNTIDINETIAEFNKFHRRYQPWIDQSIRTSDIAHGKLMLEQAEVLKRIFMAHEAMDWPVCKTALEEYFSFETANTIRQYSEIWRMDHPYDSYCMWDWNFWLVLTWQTMLDKTGHINEPMGTPVRIFSDLIKEVLVLNMTDTGKSTAWNLFERHYPGIQGVVKNASRPCENSEHDCFHVQEVTSPLGIPDDEMAEIMMRGLPWEWEMEETVGTTG